MTFAPSIDRPLDLHGTNLPGALFEGIRLASGNVRNVRWRRANLKRANLTDAIAREANFTGADMRETKLIRTDFIDAILVDVDLRGANLTNANPINATLEGADLSGADLCGAKVTLDQLAIATISDKTKLPDGITHEAVAAAKAALEPAAESSGTLAP